MTAIMRAITVCAYVRDLLRVSQHKMATPVPTLDDMVTPEARAYKKQMARIYQYLDWHLTQCDVNSHRCELLVDWVYPWTQQMTDDIQSRYSTIYRVTITSPPSYRSHCFQLWACCDLGVEPRVIFEW